MIAMDPSIRRLILPLPSHWTGLKGFHQRESTYFKLRMVYEKQFEIEILTKLLFQWEISSDSCNEFKIFWVI